MKLGLALGALVFAGCTARSLTVASPPATDTTHITAAEIEASQPPHVSAPQTGRVADDSDKDADVPRRSEHRSTGGFSGYK